MKLRIGKAYYSPEADGGGAPEDESEDTETVIKIGEKEITTDELQTLMDSEAAGTIKVNVGDGKTATLKELRERTRRDPDIQRMMDNVKAEREQLAKDREAMLAEVKAEREKTVKGLEDGSTATATKIASAIRVALEGDKHQDPFRDKSSAIAYVSGLLEKQDGVGALTAILDRFFDLKDASAAQMTKMAEEFKGKLAEAEKKAADAEVDRFMQDEFKSIKAVFPNFDPEGDDDFSVMTMRLMVKGTPSPILDNKVGKATPPVEVAKMVAAHLDAKAEARVKAKEDARKKADDSDATTVRGRDSNANAQLPDDLQKELDAAGADVDKINAVMQKFAEHLRKTK